MAEPTAATRARTEDLRLLLQSAGWGHVLTLVFQQLRHYEALLAPTFPEAIRFDAVARRGMLLDLLAALYRDAEAPSPLDTHYLQFLAAVKPPALDAVPAAEPPPPVPTKRFQRQAGSIA